MNDHGRARSARRRGGGASRASRRRRGAAAAPRRRPARPRWERRRAHGGRGGRGSDALPPRRALSRPPGPGGRRPPWPPCRAAPGPRRASSSPLPGGAVEDVARSGSCRRSRSAPTAGSARTSGPAGSPRRTPCSSASVGLPEPAAGSRRAGNMPMDRGVVRLDLVLGQVLDQLPGLVLVLGGLEHHQVRAADERVPLPVGPPGIGATPTFLRAAGVPVVVVLALDRAEHPRAADPDRQLAALELVLHLRAVALELGLSYRPSLDQVGDELHALRRLGRVDRRLLVVLGQLGAAGVPDERHHVVDEVERLLARASRTGRSACRRSR